jgi:hypothetical protein
MRARWHGMAWRGGASGKGAARRRAVAAPRRPGANVNVVTSRPVCRPERSRLPDDIGAPADYIALDMARELLGSNGLGVMVANPSVGGPGQRLD